MSDIGKPIRELEIEEPSYLPAQPEPVQEPEIEIPEPVSPEILEPVEVPANV